MYQRLILDLCSGTRGWSQPYIDAGYDVCIIDIEHNGQDVRLIKKLNEPVYGILAAPPCTVFAGSGARWKRREEEMIEGLSIVDACLRAVLIYHPVWWALENPVGKLRAYLGDPALIFQPCDYGDPYTKRTLLWGEFKLPLKTPVEPTAGSKLWKIYGGKSDKTKRMRSITPPGFAQAFFEANP